jgi:hypothetical protein
MERESSNRIAAALADYEAEFDFVRRITMPEEDGRRFMPNERREVSYRWFRAPNVICLEKCRRLLDPVVGHLSLLCLCLVGLRRRRLAFAPSDAIILSVLETHALTIWSNVRVAPTAARVPFRDRDVSK